MNREQQLPIVISSTVEPNAGALLAPAMPPQRGNPTVRQLIGRYMSVYAGRDPSRPARLAWWDAQIGEMTCEVISDDAIFLALETLASRPARYWAGTDADGRPIFRAKHTRLSPASVNRYAAAISAVFTWAMKKRLVPLGWENPCRRIERQRENNEVVRFLSATERVALFTACRQSKWPKLYLLVLLAATTGARRGELEQLRWRDIDFEKKRCAVGRTKNGDPRMLPLVPAAVQELQGHVGHPLALVFASSRRPDSPYNHVPVWHLALKRAGVKNFRFHDLRHTCASWLAQSGATLLEIADVLGHRQLSVTKRYAHLTIENKSQLINRILGQIR